MVIYIIFPQTLNILLQFLKDIKFHFVDFLQLLLFFKFVCVLCFIKYCVFAHIMMFFCDSHSIWYV